MSIRTEMQCCSIGLSLAVAITAQAQRFTTLHSFTFPDFYNSNLDGAHPESGLVLSGNMLYGTTRDGGIWGRGTVFAIQGNGSFFGTVHAFNAISDGVAPYARLVVSGNTLYGTTAGGPGGTTRGTIFKVNTDGSGFSTMYICNPTVPEFNYTNYGGATPYNLVLSGDTLYGTARHGGAWGAGTVFAIPKDGYEIRTLHSFAPFPPASETNADGGCPEGLVLSGDILYGTAAYYGRDGGGTLFSVHTDGTGFTILHSFTTGTDGAHPNEALLLLGNSLYGTTQERGASGYGTVFKANTDGTGFTTLHTFNGGSDGGYPYSGLVQSGNTLYGATSSTLFQINADGTGFTTLYNLTNNIDGENVQGVLVLSDNRLYGTAAFGGRSASGTIFSFMLPPQLTIRGSIPDVILSWATNADGYVLQSSTNLGSPFWSPVSSSPVILDGQNVVTNHVSEAQRFYRLGQ